MIEFPLTTVEFTRAVCEIADESTPKIIALFRRYDGGDPDILRNVIANTIKANGGEMRDEAIARQLRRRVRSRRAA